MNYYYITGTSSGLGKAIAETALANGAMVYGFSRTNSIAHENYIHHTIDLADLTQVKLIEFNPHPEAETIVLINNAGTAGEIKYFGEIDTENIIAGYHINAVAPHILMNNFISTYRLNNCKKIVINITSGAASSAYDGWSIYCSTKAAIDMMSVCADKEQHERNTGFTIFSIAPGVLDTPMQDKLRETAPEDFSRIDKFIDLKNKGQLADPQLVAKRIVDIVENPAQLYGVIHRIQL